MMRAVLLLLAVAATLPDTAGEDRRALLRAQGDAIAAQARAARYENEAARAVDASGRARAQASAMAARIDAAEDDVAAGVARLAEVDARQREQRARIALKQGVVVRLTAALQRLARRPAAVTVAQPGSIDDAVHLRALVAAAVPLVHQRTADLRRELAQGTRLAGEAATALAQLRGAQAQLSTERTRLAGVEIVEQQRAARLRQSASDQNERAQGLGEEARDLIDQSRRNEAGSEVVARLRGLPGPVLRPTLPGEQPFARHPAPYRLPVEGQVVTGFGETASSGVRARGVSIRTASSVSVVAPLGGRVRYAGRFRGYGTIVIIDHGGGWTSVITGLAGAGVRPGDPIAAGAAVGTAPAVRGEVTVELRRDGRPVSPAPMTLAGG